MTYREWITRTTAKFLVEPADVELILCNRADIIPNPDTKVDVRIAKTALCQEFAALIPLANIGEGGYSISWNWDAIKFWYNAACLELGITPAGKPQIRSRSNAW
jgi:hypothetical protein